MTWHTMQRLSGGVERQFGLYCFTAGEILHIAKEVAIKARQPIRVLIGLAADHHAVHVRKMLQYVDGSAHTAIEHNGKMREIPL